METYFLKILSKKRNEGKNVRTVARVGASSTNIFPLTMKYLAVVNKADSVKPSEENLS